MQQFGCLLGHQLPAHDSMLALALIRGTTRHIFAASRLCACCALQLRHPYVDWTWKALADQAATSRFLFEGVTAGGRLELKGQMVVTQMGGEDVLLFIGERGREQGAWFKYGIRIDACGLSGWLG